MISRLLVVLLAFATFAPGAEAADWSFKDSVLATNPYVYWGLGETAGPAVEHVRGWNGNYLAPSTYGGNIMQRGVAGAPVAAKWDEAVYVDDESYLGGGGYAGGIVGFGGYWWHSLQPFSVSLWVRWDGFKLYQGLWHPTQGILGNHGDAYNDGGWTIGLPGGWPGDAHLGKIHFTRKYGLSGTTVASDRPLPQNKWTLLTATYDGGTSRLYFDCEPAGSAPSTNYVAGGYNGLYLGAQDYNRYFSGYWGHFHGALDELAMWNRALTQDEIDTFCPDVVRYPSGTSKPTLIFVPGVAGSELMADVNGSAQVAWPDGVWNPGRIPFLSTTANGSVYPVTATKVQDRVLGAQIYGPALSRFRSWEGDEIREFVPFPYDWRMGAAGPATSLALILRNRCQDGEKLWVVVHSTGGLVAKLAVKRLSEHWGIDPKSCLRGVVFLATPHVGAPKAIGSAINPDLFFGQWLQRVLADQKTFASVANNWLTVWQLMPRRGDARTFATARQAWFDDPTDGKGDYNVAGDQLQWYFDRKADEEYPVHFPLSALGGVHAYNVFSYDIATPTSYGPGRCSKVGGRRVFTQLGYNAHIDETITGDETVPAWSATWPGSGLPVQAQYAVRGVKHKNVPNSGDVLELIRTLLLTNSASPGYPHWPTAPKTGLLQGAAAVQATRLRPQYVTRICSPVAAMATYAGAQSGLRPDGEIVDDIPEAMFEAARTDEGVEHTFSIPADGEGLPPQYDLVATGDGQVSIWQDEPDGSQHDFVFDVRTGDRATLRFAGSDWLLDVDRGGDGDVDETLGANHPVVAVDAAGPVDEGAEVPLHAQADAQTDEALTLSWTVVSGGGSVEGNGKDAVYRAEDGPATAVVRLTATDADGRSASADVEVAVRNVAPSVDAGSNASGAWGVPIELSGTATDPSPVDTAVGLSASWGFGAATLRASHAWAEPGQYEAALTVTDKDGGSSTDSTLVTVTRRDASLAIVSGERLEYGDRVLAATLADPLAGARLDRTPVFVLDGAEHRVQADASGRATLELSVPPAVGAHTLAVTLDDALYAAPRVERSFGVASTPGHANGNLTLASGAGLSVAANTDGGEVGGHLHWQPADGEKIKAKPTALGISGAEAWIAGTTEAGHALVVHATEARVDVWVDGVPQPGSGPVVRGNLQARRR